MSVPLTLQEVLLLRQIRARKRAATVTELTDRLRMSPSQASRVIKRLINLGLIERRWDPDDARRHMLVATRKGAGVSLNVHDYAAIVRRRSTEDIAI